MITAREMVMRVNVLRQKTAPMTEADKAEMEDLRKMAVDMQEKRQCAAAHLRMALALKPRHQHALEAIGELGSDLCCSSPEWMQRFNAKEYERKGKICFARHDWTGALANFTKCLEIDPECSGFAWHARGMAYFFYKEERGEADLDTTTTLKSFRKAVELDGDNEVFRCNYARALLAVHLDETGAMREYKAALVLRSTHLPAIDGIGTLQEAMAAQVDHISAFEMVYRGQQLYEMKSYTTSCAAYEWLKRALERDPVFSASAWHMRGCCHAKMHGSQTTESYRCYQEAARLDPSDETYKSDLRAALATVIKSRGDDSNDAGADAYPDAAPGAAREKTGEHQRASRARDKLQEKVWRKEEAKKLEQKRAQELNPDLDLKNPSENSRTQKFLAKQRQAQEAAAERAAQELLDAEYKVGKEKSKGKAKKKAKGKSKRREEEDNPDDAAPGEQTAAGKENVADAKKSATASATMSATATQHEGEDGGGSASESEGSDSDAFMLVQGRSRLARRDPQSHPAAVADDVTRAAADDASWAEDNGFSVVEGSQSRAKADAADSNRASRQRAALDEAEQEQIRRALALSQAAAELPTADDEASAWAEPAAEWSLPPAAPPAAASVGVAALAGESWPPISASAGDGTAVPSAHGFVAPSDSAPVTPAAAPATAAEVRKPATAASEAPKMPAGAADASLEATATENPLLTKLARAVESAGMSELSALIEEASVDDVLADEAAAELLRPLVARCADLLASAPPFEASAPTDDENAEGTEALRLACARLGIKREHYERLHGEDILLDDIALFEEDDLKDVGLPLGPRRRLLRAVRAEKDVAAHGWADAALRTLECPLTLRVMRDPVVAADGHSYERAEIEARFARGLRASPCTRAPLAHCELIPNHALRDAIAQLDQTGAP